MTGRTFKVCTVEGSKSKSGGMVPCHTINDQRTQSQTFIMAAANKKNSHLLFVHQQGLPAYPHNDRPHIDPTSFLTKTRRVLNQSAHCVWQCEDHGRLYVGSKQAAAAPLTEFQSLGIVAVVNVTLTVRCVHRPTLLYHQVPVADMATTDLLRHFEATSRFIHTAMEQNKGVLVHCNAGLSRSATIAMAYLLWCGAIKTRNEAYVHVKRRRVAIYPNDGFWYQLWIWEQQQERKRQSTSLSSQAILLPFSVATAIQDDNWAEASYERFARACKGDEEDDNIIEKGVVNVAHSSSPYKVLGAALAFVWKRGAFSATEMDWLTALCRALDDTVARRGNDDDMLQTTASSKHVLRQLLTDPAWQEQWCNVGATVALDEARVERVWQTVTADQNT